MRSLEFVWLEITGKCQLRCSHCYADSGPSGTDGQMRRADWVRVVDEAAALGTQMIQFIGGEPTLHPALPDLVDHALGSGLDVEVFTNLVRVTPHMWEAFAQPRVRLATSYYTDGADQHEEITGRRGSYARTKANIAEALRRSIPLRVGLIELDDGQRMEQAQRELADLGVTDIGTDHLRQVGRGVRDQGPDLSQLCGACGRGKIAVSSNGDVWPCVFARWMLIGNVREASLADIVDGPAMATTTAALAKQFDPTIPSMPCVPKMCDPQCGPNCGPACNPSCWPTGTGPCGPKGAANLTTSRRHMFVSRAYIPESLRPGDPRRWPFNVPCVAELVEHDLEFTQPVTFLVGDNGSGKSTLVEAIAEGFKLDARGGRAAVATGRPDPTKTPLGEVLRLETTATGARMLAGPRLKKKGFFLRAETAFSMTENLGGVRGYWDENTAEMSHGEGFVAVFRAMFRDPGFYVMDEPESALSFTACLHLVGLMHELGNSGAQVVCATHSPILAATPGADIIEVGEHGMRRVKWEDLELVHHWRRYLEDPDAYLRHITES